MAVVIVGILTAIALPSLLSQTNKAKESEAVQNSGAINKKQALLVTEKGEFANSFDVLAIGNLSGNTTDTNSSKYYTYRIILEGTANDTTNFGYIVS
ncbi:MAG: type IV pilin protein [Prochloraceae cyanobacterium]